MCGRAGIWKLCLLMVVMCALSTQAARGRKRCPKKVEKFERRLSNCYRPFYSSFDPDDPSEYCGVYQGIVTCMEDWVEKCSHRRWLQERREEIGEEIQEIRDRMGSACGGPY